jgi:hypothetical protein
VAIASGKLDTIAMSLREQANSIAGKINNHGEVTRDVAPEHGQIEVFNVFDNWEATTQEYGSALRGHAPDPGERVDDASAATNAANLTIRFSPRHIHQRDKLGGEGGQVCACVQQKLRRKPRAVWQFDFGTKHWPEFTIIAGCPVAIDAHQ